MRQLTNDYERGNKLIVSKLPMRQLTQWQQTQETVQLSKLPMRQLTSIHSIPPCV